MGTNICINKPVLDQVFDQINNFSRREIGNAKWTEGDETVGSRWKHWFASKLFVNKREYAFHIAKFVPEDDLENESRADYSLRFINVGGGDRFIIDIAPCGNIFRAGKILEIDKTAFQKRSSDLEDMPAELMLPPILQDLQLFFGKIADTSAELYVSN